MIPTTLYLSPTLRTAEAAHRQLPLMARAGAAAADWAAELVADRQGPILVLAGPGNNGGDAFVTAHLLRQGGFDLHLVCATDPATRADDAAKACQNYLAAGGLILSEIPSGLPWRLIVDGIFGIGLNRAPAAPYADWIKTANGLSQQLRCPLLALDCPSGLDADHGALLGDAIHASHTLSFIGAKPGLYTGDGPDHCGIVRIADLQLTGADLPPADGAIISPSLFAQWLLPRRRNSHKGSFGSAGIAGGAPSMTGAAILAGRAALKLGAGRVYLGLLDSQSTHFDPTQAELMIRRPAGLLDAGLSALACGPGLGGSLEAVGILEIALATDLPLVLDADALSLLAQEANLKSALASRSAPTLLTPHPGEASSLLDCEIADIQSDRIAAACEIAKEFSTLVALKGCGSVVATPDADWWINTTGNPGMATAGMGDVLTGLTVSLLAQGWPALEALLAAVHLHGSAADAIVAEGIGPVGLTAGEIIDPARRLFNDWLRHV